YTLTNSVGPGTGRVSITVSDTIWFVDASAGGGGNGTQASPFNCLVGPGCFDTVAADDPGDTIFLYSGNYTGGLTLLNNQKLVGQGASAPLASITGITLPSGSAAFPSTGGANPIITTGGAVNGI